MTVEIKVRLDAASEARATAVLQSLLKKAAHPASGLKIVGEALLREQNRRFQSQTDPSGKPWAKLAPLTVAIRGSTGPILRRSGQLMRSGNWRVSGSTLHVGIKTPYAAAHQFGATIKAKNTPRLAIPMRQGQYARPQQVTLPARPMVGFGIRDMQATKQAVEDWLTVEGAEK